MNTLFAVMELITRSPQPLAQVVLSVRDWESVRDECREYCEDNDEPFAADPKMSAPNFLVFGIPIIQAGTA